MYPSLCRNEIASRQCSGYVTFWYGSGSADPYLRIRILLFSSVTYQMPTNNYIYCCLLLFEGTLTSFFQDKKYYRSRKQFFLTILVFLLDERSIRIRNSDYRIRIREVQKVTDSDRNTASRFGAKCRLKNFNNFPFSIIFHEVLLNPREKSGVPQFCIFVLHLRWIRL